MDQHCFSPKCEIITHLSSTQDDKNDLRIFMPLKTLIQAPETVKIEEQKIIYIVYSLVLR